MRYVPLLLVAVLVGLIACSEGETPSEPESKLEGTPYFATDYADGSRLLLYATGKIPSRIVSVVDVTDSEAITLLDWGISHDLFQHDAYGVDVDAYGNVIFAGGWWSQSWLAIVDATLTVIGETSIADAVPGDPLDVAFRSSDQAVACSRVAPGTLSRILVFDVGDLTNPNLTNAFDIPGTGWVDGCRSIAFDETGDLWVTTGGDGNLVAFSLDADGLPTSTQVFPLSYPWGAVEMAIEPGTDRVFLSLINSGHIGVVDLADPTVSAAMITDVCESALGSPQGLDFSPQGDLYVGCSNYYGVTDDLKRIPASSLVGLTGNVSAATLNPTGVDLGPPGVVGSDGTMAFLAIGPEPFLPPSEAINAIKATVDDFEADGSINNHGIAESLRAFLTHAETAIGLGDTDSAIKSLEKFIDHVEKKTPSHIAVDAGQALIEAAQAIIGQLTG